MANPVPNPVAAPLTMQQFIDLGKLPDFIRDLQNYDGKPTELLAWLTDVEGIFCMYRDARATEAQLELIERSVRRKIRGEAADILNSNNIVHNWQQIKSTLLLYYRDKRDIKTLDFELTTIKKNSNETLGSYYSRVNELLSSIVAQIQTEEKLAPHVNSHIDYFREKTVDAFIRGLEKPLCQLLKTFNPKTLNQAYQFCLDYYNMDTRSAPFRNEHFTPAPKPRDLEINRLPPRPPPRRYPPPPIPAPRNLGFPQMPLFGRQYFQANPFTQTRPQYQPNPFQAPPRPWAAKPLPKPEPMDIDQIHQKVYPYPAAYADEVKKQINKLLEDGIVRPSRSAWTAPVWVVPKKPDASGEKKFRMVIDYRKVNEKTIPDKYPMPEIGYVLDQLKGQKYFTTLDLASGFHQIKMKEKDIEKTAFAINNGKYEFTRMPFGLKNAPAIFQRAIDDVLRDHIGKICYVYIDDVVVFGKTLDEHLENLKIVLETLRKYKTRLLLLRFRLLLLLFIQPDQLLSRHDVTADLRDVGRQPVLIFDQGEARIKLDHTYYIHYFNLTTIRMQVKSLRDQFENFSQNQFSDLVEEKFNEIDFALKSIDPIRRHKRWDSVGTVWKFIAGSPDANDLRIINSTINNLVTNNNEQIRINREINLQLKEAMFETKKAINLFNTRSIEMYSTKILFHLNYLSKKLNQITDAIMLAKLGIVNEKILSQREIDILINDLARENITVHTALEATNYATTSVATNNLEIALMIKMPKLDPRIFNKVRLYPIIHKNKQIHIDHRFYLTHKDEVYSINSIEPTIFNANEINLDNSTCIPKLLKGEQATCNFTVNPVEEEVIFLDNQHLFINTIKNFTLSSNCGITNRNLTGPFVVFFRNCQLYINNASYNSRMKTLPGNPIQLPLDGIAVKMHQEILNISLDHLHKLHLETRKELDVIRLSTNSIKWPTLSLFGGIMSLPSLIGIAFLLRFLIHRSSTINIQQAAPTTTVEDPVPDIQPNIRHLTIREVIRTEPHLLGRTS
ncbi:uncharacterized protein LOC131428341 [Malaya genurostris]|uniref:uncharacterized protein LOC131428341 n=1 Tax=Malaya genurostris TaxID=325434 RepID=UPI0026F3B205|nr:uncharacterized protein LOC131428341 [Malaya genurostris]